MQSSSSLAWTACQRLLEELRRRRRRRKGSHWVVFTHPTFRPCAHFCLSGLVFSPTKIDPEVTFSFTLRDNGVGAKLRGECECPPVLKIFKQPVWLHSRGFKRLKQSKNRLFFLENRRFFEAFETTRADDSPNPFQRTRSSGFFILKYLKNRNRWFFKKFKEPANPGQNSAPTSSPPPFFFSYFLLGFLFFLFLFFLLVFLFGGASFVS